MSDYIDRLDLKCQNIEEMKEITLGYYRFDLEIWAALPKEMIQLEVIYSENSCIKYPSTIGLFSFLSFLFLYLGS